MITKTDIINFIAGSLADKVSSSNWIPMTGCDFTERLGNDYSIFIRKTPLASVDKNCTSDFSQYQSLLNIRSQSQDDDKIKKLVVACDSEWQEYEGEDETYRFIISWQFAFIRGNSLFELIFFAKNADRRLDLSAALSVIFAVYHKDHYKYALDMRKVITYCAIVHTANGGIQHISFKTKQEALKVSSNVMTLYDIPKDKSAEVCLLFHMGLVDLTAFDASSTDDLLPYIHSIQKGLVTMNSVTYFAELQHNKYRTHKHIYSLVLSIRDTMCQAPAGHRSLKELGASVGYNKIELGDDWITRMGELIITDPLKYMEYASTDSVVTLLYAANLYGYNARPKVTLTSAAAKVMACSIKRYMNITDNEDFNRKYRGLHKISRGKVHLKESEIPYIQAIDLEPINIDSHHVQYMGSMAYHGGYNTCIDVGYFAEQTYDFDLKNAYPTSMCLVPDIDWESPIVSTFKDVELADVGGEWFKDDNPMQFILANVTSFSFPKDVLYPCIPVVVDGTPIYPSEYSVEDPACAKVPMVFITGPELYLCYKLGANVKLKEGYFLRPRYNGNGSMSKSLAAAVKQLVTDRNIAKANGDKFSDQILKIMVNSCYGKVAQNVISKCTWSAWSEEMEDIGPSIVTNPVSAAFITAIVRCTLIAAQNECNKLNCKVYSCTTDGFISNISEQALKSLPLYGFRQLLYGSRMFLTNNASGEIWETKHQQTDLLNFTTRGNVSCSLQGVCAHNGAVSGYTKDSVEDRLWLTKAVLSRTGKVEFDSDVWTTFKEIVLHKKADFNVMHSKRKISMDFDMKRKPVMNSFTTVKPVIDGKEYEIACFTTVPYDNVGDYVSHRSLMKWITEERKRSPSKSLRTVYDWTTLFWKKLAVKNKILSRTARESAKRTAKGVGTNDTRTDIAKPNGETDQSVNKKIRNCLYAYRAGVVDIPLLSSGTVKDFLKVLNHSGLTDHVFTTEQYKNYGKSSRWPLAIQSGDPDMIKHFLEDQEPVLSAILALSSDYSD